VWKTGAITGSITNSLKKNRFATATINTV